jgi:hypothetical protein
MYVMSIKICLPWGIKATRHKFADYIEENGKIDFYARDPIFIEKESSLKDSRK